jgi:cytochrome c
VLIAALVVLLAACTRLPGCTTRPEPPGQQAALPVEAPTESLPARLARADVDRGRVLFSQCSACHTLEPGGPSGAGPNLYGFMGRRAGAGSFGYSDAMRGSGITWSPAVLDALLADPRRVLPRTRMVFTPLDRPQDRADLVLFLMRETDAGQVAIGTAP